MKIRQLPTKPADKWVVPGDIHFDQEDPAALAVMTDVMIGEGVNGMILVGDTMNSMGISRHQSLKATRHYLGGSGTIKSELFHAKPWVEDWEALITKRREDESRTGGLEVIEGNHENWFNVVQDDYPGFLGMKWHELYGDLFNKWHMNDDNTGLKLTSLLIVHGDSLRGALSKKSAAKVLQEYPGQNTLYGHTHRQDSAVVGTLKDGTQEFHGAFTVGHMRDRDSELSDKYSKQHAERHRQGFGLITIIPIGNKTLGFNVDLVPIHRDENDRPFAVIGGRLYGEH